MPFGPHQPGMDALMNNPAGGMKYKKSTPGAD